MHTDGCQLFFVGRDVNPDPGFAGYANSSDGELGSSAYHYLFQHTHVPVDVLPDARQIQNGVADDLTGTMIGYISAAIGEVKFHILLAKNMVRSEQILALAIAAESDDVRMFAEKEHVIDRTTFAGGYDALLQCVSVGVGNEAEVDDLERIHEMSYKSDIGDQKSGTVFAHELWRLVAEAKFLPLYVNLQATDRGEGIAHRLPDRWMRVDHVHHIVDGSFQVKHGSCLCQDFRG